jgi:hypothetical protein
VATAALLLTLIAARLAIRTVGATLQPSGQAPTTTATQLPSPSPSRPVASTVSLMAEGRARSAELLPMRFRITAARAEPLLALPVVRSTLALSAEPSTLDVWLLRAALDAQLERRVMGDAHLA